MAHARSNTGRTNLLFYYFFLCICAGQYFFPQCRKREDITSLWMAAPTAAPTASPAASPAAEGLISKEGQTGGASLCLLPPPELLKAELSQAQVHPVPLSSCLPWTAALLPGSCRVCPLQFGPKRWEMWGCKSSAVSTEAPVDRVLGGGGQWLL